MRIEKAPVKADAFFIYWERGVQSNQQNSVPVSLMNSCGIFFQFFEWTQYNNILLPFGEYISARQIKGWILLVASG